MRILLAEDSALHATIAKRVLEKLGLEVEVVTDGAQAVRVTAERAFDLVLMDVQMPNMDGVEATHRIRERERVTGGRLPIVALTADAVEACRDRFHAAGMDECLSKPFDLPSLHAILGRFGHPPGPDGGMRKRP